MAVPPVSRSFPAPCKRLAESKLNNPRDRDRVLPAAILNTPLAAVPPPINRRLPLLILTVPLLLNAISIVVVPPTAENLLKTPLFKTDDFAPPSLKNDRSSNTLNVPRFSNTAPFVKSKRFPPLRVPIPEFTSR